MKKIVFFTAVLFLAMQGKAQVGIGTTAPQKALHISGTVTSTQISSNNSDLRLVSPTVRVEGLGNSGELLRPVSVTGEGDMIRSSLLVNPVLVIDRTVGGGGENDYLPSDITNTQTATGANNYVLRTFSIQLPNPSIVRFSSVTSFKLQNASGLALTDNSSKVWGTRFRITSQSTSDNIGLNQFFGESYQRYSNSAATSTGVPTDINLYANAEDMLSLPAGEYTFEIVAYIESQTGTSAVRVVNGNANNDSVTIIAYPIL